MEHPVLALAAHFFFRVVPVLVVGPTTARSSSFDGVPLATEAEIDLGSIFAAPFPSNLRAQSLIASPYGFLAHEIKKRRRLTELISSYVHLLLLLVDPVPAGGATAQVSPTRTPLARHRRLRIATTDRIINGDRGR